MKHLFEVERNKNKIERQADLKAVLYSEAFAVTIAAAVGKIMPVQPSAIGVETMQPPMPFAPPLPTEQPDSTPPAPESESGY